MYPEFLKRNVSFAAISTDDTADALKMMELTGAEFAILSDEDAEVSKATEFTTCCVTASRRRPRSSSRLGATSNGNT